MLKHFAKSVGIFGYVIQYGCWTHCVFEYIGDFVIVSQHFKILLDVAAIIVSPMKRFFYSRAALRNLKEKFSILEVKFQCNTLIEKPKWKLLPILFRCDIWQLRAYYSKEMRSLLVQLYVANPSANLCRSVSLFS